LRRLRDRGLLEKQGSGNRTYYTLSAPGFISTQGVLPLNDNTEPVVTLGDLVSSHKLEANSHKRDNEFPQVQTEISASLLERIKSLGSKPRQQTLRTLIMDLCSVRTFSAAELCELFGRKDPRDLTRNHLKPMREAGKLVLRYPESAKHPHQAYMVPEIQESDRG
jgi:ATP-dependent DNA helicase RecG